MLYTPHIPVQIIITGTDAPALRAKTKQVSSFGKNLATLVTDLLDTLSDARGIGLAAPQIGVSQRVIIVKIGGVPMPMVNPVINWKSNDILLAEEGCLSLPGIWLPVPRAVEIVVAFHDQKGEDHERKLSGLDARVVQHEVDHLDGILITDYHAKKTDVKTPAL